MKNSSINTQSDTSQNILHHERPSLDRLFKPKTIAIIGSIEREDSAAATIISNLLNSRSNNNIYAVNSESTHIAGVKSFPTIASLPEEIDLAIIDTPFHILPNIIDECVEAAVKGAIIISSQDREIDYELERQIAKTLQYSSLRVIGPDSLGIINTFNGLNAIFANTIAKAGSVGFISQSRSFCTTILDWSVQNQVGFSHFISTGSMIDVDWSELLYYLGDDHRTQSIVLYIESVRNVQSFLSAAREVALIKPIIAIKAGSTEAAAKASAKYRGILPSNNEVFNAALDRCGVLRVSSIAELFYMSEILAKQPHPKGPRLMIFTNAGGPALMATDALINGSGRLAELSDKTISELNQILPPQWSHTNPINIPGNTPANLYAEACAIAIKDTGCDGLLAILAPQNALDATQTAEQIKLHIKANNKPMLASWMGGASVIDGTQILTQANIPTFPYPDTVARMFNYMWKYNDNLRNLYETPVSHHNFEEGDTAKLAVEAIIKQAHILNRTLLTQSESAQILAAYGIPVISSAQEEQPQENSSHIVPGVINRSDSLELILASRIDPQFGPIIFFGAGGPLVEVYQDHQVGLPPLNTTLAHNIIKQTRIYHALKGELNNRAIDMSALENVMVQFSRLIVEQPWIKEICIKPLLASYQGVFAADAQINIYDAKVKLEKLPQPAIRPYPTQYISQWTMKNGISVTIRPICPEDEPLMINFHKTLSSKSIYYRYFYLMSLNYRISHERLAKVCFIDYDREMALVVEHKDNQTGVCEIIAVGRLIKSHSKNEAEYAIAISDQFQKFGLGTELLKRLLQIGRDEKLDYITANILPENHAMQHISKKLGFQIHYSSREEAMLARVALEPISSNRTI